MSYTYDKATALKPFQPPNPELELWAGEHGCRMDSQVYRIEIVIDWKQDNEVVPYVVFYRYQLNADGDKFFDQLTGDAAVMEPLRVPLQNLPPVNWIYTDASNLRQSSVDCVH